MTSTSRALRRILGASLALALTSLAGCTAVKRCAYEGFDRDDWQQPDRVVESLAIEPGDRIADLGAGGGYFTFRLADATGPTGTVYAADVDEGMIGFLRDKAKQDGYANVEAILGEYHDPLLPEDGVDLIFSSNTYHHLEDRTAYFRNARKYLRPGGRVAIVEFNGEGWSLLGRHATPPEQIRSELEAAGFQLAQDHDYLAKQSFQVFTIAE
ncbi:MAG: class I SAM-dependent methyltransferase [Deltaproteobacteria bacterium]|nr:MAG: class I SAM-dependent methyltransferase [Deltaproteobacteria bacterium]